MAEISCATTFLIKNSPHPVHEIPAVSLLAYVPAPIIGESPTLPYFLFVIPPVEVAAARFPFLSSATAPTVPNL
ncbi:hypothetical protein D3C86_2172290 [compost metagenome]